MKTKNIKMRHNNPSVERAAAMMEEGRHHSGRYIDRLSNSKKKGVAVEKRLS